MKEPQTAVTPLLGLTSVANKGETAAVALPSLLGMTGEVITRSRSLGQSDRPRYRLLSTVLAQQSGSG